MTKKSNSPVLTWDCAPDLESRISKTLFFAEKSCYSSIPSATLTDHAVSMYLSAARSPKRRLEPGYACALTRRVNVMPCTLMMGILYSERLRHSKSEYLQKISSSDLFLVSMLVASKYLVDEGEDDEIYNDQWAEAGGLAVSTVNRLEREFLEALDWRVFVKPDEFYSLCSTIETSVALKHGLKRGWFSYTDLTVFLATMQYKKTMCAIVQNTLKIVATCLIMYGATIGTLVTIAKFLNAARQFNQNESSRSVDRLEDLLEPFANRVITRERVQLLPLRPQNETINNLLRHHYVSQEEEETATDELYTDVPTSDSMRGLKNNIRPCPSSEHPQRKSQLEERIMSLVLSWPHCLKGFGHTIPRKALETRQLKLGHQELVSRFETRMFRPGAAGHSSGYIRTSMNGILSRG